MRPLPFFGLALLVITASAFARELPIPATNSVLQSLYEQHQWFELRDALVNQDGPKLYQGAVAVAFGDGHRAEKYLRTVIKDAPESVDANHAYGLLASYYYRSGHYQQGSAVAEEVLARHPDNIAFQKQRDLMAAFKPYPAQKVIKWRHSTIPLEKDKSGLFIPLSINGHPAKYLVDTAADLCLINASEARRLGLTVRTNVAKANGAGGSQFAFDTAMASQLDMGGVRLANVLFFVIPDGQLPFSESPADKQGLIGSAVLQGLKTVRWKSDGTFEVAFPTKKKTIKDVNFCYEGANVVTELEFKEQKLGFVLDTGSFETVMYQPFARKFSDWLHQVGTEGYTTMTGFGGSPKIHSVTAPEMHLKIANFDTTLRPAKVLLESTTGSSEHAFGLLGMDLVNQATEVSIDYQAMTIAVR